MQEIMFLFKIKSGVQSGKNLISKRVSSSGNSKYEFIDAFTSSFHSYLFPAQTLYKMNCKLYLT